LYRERTVAILSRFAPYQFVLYETNYGNWLREETKKAIEREEWERIKTLGSDVLEGLCRAFEKDALETIKGYEFGEIKKRLREDLEEVSEEVREGYELYGKLKEKAEDFVRRGHELVEETHTREKIFKASLLVASRDKYFESNYMELISWPVEKLYAMAGEYSPVEVCDPRIEAEDIQELARNIDYMETHSEQMWHITPKLEELKEKLETKGYKELADKVNEHLNACYKKEELENFPDDLKDDGMNLMKEIIEELEKAKKRPIKITSW
ncbi:MAG: hypothetical protein QMD12_03280, partial [Candidatus Aenigmarchaeota archaeon]|nr:hypothetical protein [Candidatus Aenigmarchaeota archaeon]